MSTYDLQRDGEIIIEGRMPWSSNATFLVQLTGPEAALESDSEPVLKGIYKPLKGERPLWDYPTGLFRREVAAYELSAFLGWDVIPRTVARGGPYGLGSLQRFVDANFEEHYFTLRESRPDLDGQLRRLAAFDVLANSGDRKSGHVLIEQLDGAPPRIWGIDNGLSFHDDYKLRTVMWDYAGDPIDAGMLTDIERLACATSDELSALYELLSADEVDMLLDRAQELLGAPRFPYPASNHAYPWPMV